ncbi:MAG: hypothetical protein IPM03_01905 [Sulfuritalea sp.]|nr:hypothetical protein [Sulfuritalea sp.]
MNRPRIGERYEACEHATPGKQHWWSVKGRWIALCAVCHKAFAAKKPVALKAATLTRDDDRPLMDLSSRKPEVLNFDFPWGGRANKKSEG